MKKVIAGVLLVLLATPAQAIVPRVFKDTSYWNTPIDKSGPAPVHSRNATYIADSQKTANTQNWLKLSMGNYAQPIFSSSCTDKAYTVNPVKYGDTKTLRIPVAARPAPGNDSQMVIYDMCQREVFGLHQAAYNSTSDTWTASSLDHYGLDTEGLEKDAATTDSATNDGHRGIPPPVRAVEKAEIEAGVIPHRLECFWHLTAAQTPEVGDNDAYWPMTGAENKTGIVPEGVVIRIKRSVNLANYSLSPAARIIAKALQDYGCTVGDNSGSGNRLKVQRNTSWTGILNVDSLKPLTWNLWEFVKGGYDPRTGVTR